jgi:Fe-S cluster assembly scaffold protein SufB
MQYSFIKLAAIRLTLLCFVCVATSLAALPAFETLSYTVEWKLIEAGKAVVTKTPAEAHGSPGSQIEVKLDSVGLVSRLYKVDDLHRVLQTGNFCAAEIYAKSSARHASRWTPTGTRRVTWSRIW